MGVRRMKFKMKTTQTSETNRGNKERRECVNTYIDAISRGSGSSSSSSSSNSNSNSGGDGVVIVIVIIIVMWQQR